MRQSDPNRLEEYITLRDELRELLAHGRQILYWTSGFVFAALAWFLGRPDQSQLNPAVFGAFLLAMLFASVLVYVNNLSDAFRIGSYLAVFWESSDLERRLKWHRFNRRGAPGGLTALTAQLAYAALASLVVGFLAHSFFTVSIEKHMQIIPILVIGTGETLLFVWLSSFLSNRRQAYDLSWRAIRASIEWQEKIHDVYDAHNGRRIDGNGSSLIHIP